MLVNTRLSLILVSPGWFLSWLYVSSNRCELGGECVDIAEVEVIFLGESVFLITAEFQCPKFPVQYRNDSNSVVTSGEFIASNVRRKVCLACSLEAWHRHL